MAEGQGERRLGAHGSAPAGKLYHVVDRGMNRFPIRCRTVGREDDETFEALNAPQEILDLEVRVAVVGGSHVTVPPEESVGLIQEEHRRRPVCLGEQVVEVLLGLAHGRADDPVEIHPMHAEPELARKDLHGTRPLQAIGSHEQRRDRAELRRGWRVDALSGARGESAELRLERLGKRQRRPRCGGRSAAGSGSAALLGHGRKVSQLPPRVNRGRVGATSRPPARARPPQHDGRRCV